MLFLRVDGLLVWAASATFISRADFFNPSGESNRPSVSFDSLLFEIGVEGACG